MRSCYCLFAPHKIISAMIIHVCLMFDTICLLVLDENNYAVKQCCSIGYVTTYVQFYLLHIHITIYDYVHRIYDFSSCCCHMDHFRFYLQARGQVDLLCVLSICIHFHHELFRLVLGARRHSISKSISSSTSACSFGTFPAATPLRFKNRSA